LRILSAVRPATASATIESASATNSMAAISVESA
jgi:hypothetical protein